MIDVTVHPVVRICWSGGSYVMRSGRTAADWLSIHHSPSVSYLVDHLTLRSMAMWAWVTNKTKGLRKMDRRAHEDLPTLTHGRISCVSFLTPAC